MTRLSSHTTWAVDAPLGPVVHPRWRDKAYFRLIGLLYQRRAVTSRSQFNERQQ